MKRTVLLPYEVLARLSAGRSLPQPQIVNANKFNSFLAPRRSTNSPASPPKVVIKTARAKRSHADMHESQDAPSCPRPPRRAKVKAAQKVRDTIQASGISYSLEIATGWRLDFWEQDVLCNTDLQVTFLRAFNEQPAACPCPRLEMYTVDCVVHLTNCVLNCLLLLPADSRC
jgi:hypothetical protein